MNVNVFYAMATDSNFNCVSVLCASAEYGFNDKRVHWIEYGEKLSRHEQFAKLRIARILVE